MVSSEERWKKCPPSAAVALCSCVLLSGRGVTPVGLDREGNFLPCSTAVNDELT